MDFFTVVLAAVLLVLLYWHGTSGQGLFKSKGIPGPRPLPGIGNLLWFASSKRFQNFLELGKKYGKVFGLYVGYQPLLVVQDLDMVKQVLVKDFNNFVDRWLAARNKKNAFSKNMFSLQGDQWRNLRNIVSPTFSGGKLRNMCTQINQCAQVLRSNALEKAKRGEIVDTKSLFGAYTMDVIALTSFGLEVDSQHHPDDPFVQHAKRIFSVNFFTNPKLVLKLLFRSLRNVDITLLAPDILHFFTEVTRQTIEERKKSGEKRMDFLQLLLDAEADVTQEAANGKPAQDVTKETANGKAAHDVTEAAANGKATPSSKKRLTMEEIVGQSLLFFIAGYETTASTLSFLAHSVAVHPQVQERMFQEIQEELGDEEPSYDNIGRLKYMEQVVFETLRLYPPATMLFRQAKEDCQVGGVKMEAGTAIAIPLYAIHHDPDLYPDPETFDPDRMDADSRAARHPMAFQPFGQGPRMCIGMRLSLVETKIALVHVIRAVRFLRCEQTPVPLNLLDRGVLQPERPIRLRVEAR